MDGNIEQFGALRLDRHNLKSGMLGKCGNKVEVITDLGLGPCDRSEDLESSYPALPAKRSHRHAISSTGGGRRLPRRRSGTGGGRIKSPA